MPIPIGGNTGSIPAWAGETTPESVRAKVSTVYPRVGGGNIRRCSACSVSAGLSPRGRGKRGRCLCARGAGWSIPAWAGETQRLDLSAAPLQVYPRVGGGNVGVCPLQRRALGLSPRGRGKPLAAAHGAGSKRSIPAWAGETSTTSVSKISVKVYPRVGGGNHTERTTDMLFHGLSPRGRGKHVQIYERDAVERSIPAWAGETWDKGAAGLTSAVYPRVGGGNCAKGV